MEKFTKFARLAETEFPDIVISTHDLGHKLRVYLKDKSFIDFFYSTKSKITRFAIHWERVHLDGNFYRLDNTPDKNWSKVKTYPLHFHDKIYENVTSSPFESKNKTLLSIFRQFLNFVLNKSWLTKSS